MTHHRSLAARRAGFTLVEVLMAAFIIALGVLGLSALFAGTARQQQVASQTTTAVVISNNAQAMVGRNIGRVDGEWLADPDFADEEGLWFPIPTPEDENYLSIDAANDGDVDGDLYFLVDEPHPVRLVEFPQNAAYDSYHQIVWNNLDNPPSLPDQNAILRALPNGRVDPASVSRIIVCLGSTLSTEPSSCSEEYTFKFVSGSALQTAINDGAVSGTQSDAPWAGGSFDDRVAAFYFPNGSPDYSNYIILDLGLGTPPDVANPRPAHIRHFFMERIQDEPQLQLRSIELESYSWRNDKLLSLPNRVITKEDSSSSTGRRPDMSFSLLYRTYAAGSTQLGIFTYQISAVDGQALRPSPAVRAGQSLYAPPERREDFIRTSGDPGTAPITRVDGVELAHDDELGVYYISVDDDARKRWVAEPGQLLVMQAEGNTLKSADAAVRVLRKTTLPNGRIRADLDRAPRAQGESFLSDLDTPEDVRVWAVQETVKNLRGGGTWKLDPLDFRVVQVR